MSRTYLDVFALRRRRRREVDGPWVLAGRVALALTVLLLLTPMVSSSFLYFVERPYQQAIPGLQEAWFRASLLVMVVLALDVHATVLRGPARDVLSLMPVDPRRVVVAELVEVAWKRLPYLLALGWLMLPVREIGSMPPMDGWMLWGLGMVVVLGTAVLTLVLSAVMFLGAIDAAESPSMAPLLDLLRGNNPRAQAALIYALVPSTMLTGSLAAYGSAVAATAFEAEQVAWWWWLAPFAAAAVAWPAMLQLADRNWFRASVVLADIRARYASVEGADEALHVYLEWTVRWLPVAIGRWAMLDLRYGWRERRMWLSLTWLVGLAALATGWSFDADAPLRAGLVAGVAAWLAGGVVVQARADTAEFLLGWLPVSTATRAAARLWVAVAWAQGPLLLAGFAGWMFHGTDGALQVLTTAEVSVVLAASAAVLVTMGGRALMPLYVAVALLGIMVSATWHAGGLS